jgi:Lipid A 3-O-deacylase (PagL)
LANDGKDRNDFAIRIYAKIRSFAFARSSTTIISPFMGIVHRQGFKHSIVNYIGLGIGLLSTVLICPFAVGMPGVAQLLFVLAIPLLTLGSLRATAIAIPLFVLIYRLPALANPWWHMMLKSDSFAAIYTIAVLQWRIAPDLNAMRARIGRRLLSAGLLLLCGSALQAQAPPQDRQAVWSVGTATYYGTIWKHTPKLTIRTGAPLWGHEVSVWARVLRGRDDWPRRRRYPFFGVALQYWQLGDASHRDAAGVLAGLIAPVAGRGRWMAAVRVGCGAARVSEPHDTFDNPAENAIGSHWNYSMEVQVHTAAHLSSHVRLLAGAGMHHMSNGAGELPNFGVNLPVAFLSLQWMPRAEVLPTSVPRADQPFRRWGALAYGGWAEVEFSVPDGPKYPIRMATLAATYHLTRTNRLMVGLDGEFNRAIYFWGLHTYNIFDNEREARTGATRLALWVGDEVRYGPIGIHLQYAWYIGSAINREVPERRYAKTGVRYYFPALFRSSVRPNAGLYLKTHRFTAEYISINAGFAF